MQKIDFVLPWVDGSDKDWQQRKNNYSTATNMETHNARYRDMETLRYVLRSIERNCPWFNKIYLITEGHYPKWLDINHDKIVLVTHEELYYNKSHLPTFSSSSIEMNLPNLQNLSDQFVYLNDDTIIMNKLTPKRFFVKGKPVDFFAHGWIPRNKVFGKFRRMDAWVHSINNNIKLINNKFDISQIDNMLLFHDTYSTKDKISNFLMKYIYKKIIWIEHWHFPQPYLKSTLYEVYHSFKNEMMTCSSNRFRANNDLTQYLFRYWQLVTENFYPYKYNDGYVGNIRSLQALKEMIYKINNNKNINFVCFNDDINLSDEEFTKVKKELISFLNQCFPNKASFEKD